MLTPCLHPRGAHSYLWHGSHTCSHCRHSRSTASTGLPSLLRPGETPSVSANTSSQIEDHRQKNNSQPPKQSHNTFLCMFSRGTTLPELDFWELKWLETKPPNPGENVAEPILSTLKTYPTSSGTSVVYDTVLSIWLPINALTKCKFYIYSLPRTVHAGDLFYNGEQEIPIRQIFLKPQIWRQWVPLRLKGIIPSWQQIILIPLNWNLHRTFGSMIMT